MKKLIAWAAVICIEGALVGCGKQQVQKVSAENTAVLSNAAISNAINAQEFIKFLGDSGLKVSISHQGGVNTLNGKFTVLQIKEDNIGIYEYKSSEEMEQDAKTIRDDGSMVGNAIIEWKAIPHFYKGGNIIVSYIGDNKELIDKIEKYMGKQFEGGK